MARKLLKPRGVGDIPAPLRRTGKRWGKEYTVSSGAKSGKDGNTKAARPVHEAVALSNKLFFQTAVVRYGSWERFLESKGKAPIVGDEAQDSPKD